MNPLEQYISIIHLRQQNPLPEDEYGEVHHIIPRSCGGCNEEWNLIKLTPEEHYRCHSILPFIYTEGHQHQNLVRAWNLMFYTTDGVEISQEEYGSLKREFSRMQSAFMKGRTQSEESNRKRSQTLRGRPGRVWTEESRQKMREKHLGLHHSEKTKKLMSMQRRGRKLTEEHKRKISENHHSPGMTGKKHSPETIEKMRRSAREREARKRAAV